MWHHLTWWMWTLMTALALGVGATALVLTALARQVDRPSAAPIRGRKPRSRRLLK